MIPVELGLIALLLGVIAGFGAGWSLAHRPRRGDWSCTLKPGHDGPCKPSP